MPRSYPKVYLQESKSTQRGQSEQQAAGNACNGVGTGGCTGTGGAGAGAGGIGAASGVGGERVGGIGTGARVGNSSSSSSYVVLKRPRGVGSGVLINDHGHALPAVINLAAVYPESSAAIYRDCIDRNRSSPRSDRHVARPEARIGAVNLRDWYTGIIEIRLSNGVVARQEMELNEITRSSSDIIGKVLENSLIGHVHGIRANGNNVGSGSMGDCGESRNSERSKMHLEMWFDSE